MFCFIMKAMRLLLVEDDVHLSQSLLELLERESYGVDAVYTAADALKYATSAVYDGIIFDPSLPGKEGLSVVKTLRDNDVHTPILILSDKCAVRDIVKGLDAGADDYVCNPFNQAELLARIRAVTRRKGDFKKNRVTCGDLILDKDNCELQHVKGGAAKLSLKELQIIEFLFDSPHQVIKKERIIEKIWGSDSDAEYNNVEVYISFIRKKMDDLGAKTRIRTARGIGYSLEDTL